MPVCAICRSKYGEYPEYHTSKDDMALITPSGLFGGFEIYKKCIVVLENNYKYKVNVLCEPQLGKRGLYPIVSQKGNYSDVKSMRDFIAYADGSNDLVDISNIIGVPVENLLCIAFELKKKNLVVEV